MWSKQQILFLQYCETLEKIFDQSNAPGVVENFQNNNFLNQRLEQISLFLIKFRFLLRKLDNYEIFDYEKLKAVLHKDFFVSEHFLKLSKHYTYFIELDMESAQKLLDLILSFEVDEAINLVRKGVACDYQDPRTGATAMHLAASFGTKRLCEVIAESETYDPLLMDFNRELPSTVAFDMAHDAELSEWLSIMESQRAKQLGLSYFKILQGGLEPIPEV